MKHLILKILQRIIRPTNWLLLVLGIVFTGIGIYALVSGQDWVTSLVLIGTGLDFVVSAYSEVKEDEDLEAE